MHLAPVTATQLAEKSAIPMAMVWALQLEPVSVNR